MCRCKFAAFAAFGLLALVAGKSSQAQQWVVSDYSYSVVSVDPNPSNNNVSAGWDQHAPSVFAITQTDGSQASVSVYYSRRALWTGPADSVPTAISVKSTGNVQGFATSYGNSGTSCSSSVGNIIGSGVRSYPQYTSPPYNMSNFKQVDAPAGYTREVRADFTLSATASNNQGYGTGTGTIEFTF